MDLCSKERFMLRTLILLAALHLLTVAEALGQGTIAGVVLDQKTSEPIIGANVVLQGTQTGSATDIDGKFLIANVPNGTYNLQISSITYKTHTIPDVIVESGKRITIDVMMLEDVSELAEIVVSGTRQIDNDFSLISAIRESKLVVSGVSAEIIARSPDRDAAEVVKRVPGVSIMSGKFVVIRGLSERYNVTMLHNAYAPSMEADKRSFAFDIIPTGQIDQMLVFKSPSPELPGDFAGGLVKITTKGIPDENSLSVSYSTGYRSGTSLGDFSQTGRTGLQWFGFNEGTNDLPSGFPKNLNSVTSDEKINKAGRALNNDWVPQNTQAFLDQSASISGSFKTRIRKIQIGNITAINWSNSRIRYNVDRRDFNEFQGTLDPTYMYNDDQNTQQTKLGALFNWGFRINENHSVELKNLFNQIYQSQFINRTGTNIQDGWNARFGAISDVYRGIYSGQLLGKHKIREGKTNFNWLVGYNNSNRNVPDMRRYRRDLDTQTGKETNFLPTGAVQTFYLGRIFMDLKESGYNASAGIDHTFEISKNFLPVLSAGFYYEQKERDFSARNLGYVVPLGYDRSLDELPIDQLFKRSNINMQDGLRLDEQTNATDSYMSSNTLQAYYTSLSLPLGKINVSGGVRVEQNTQQLRSTSSENEIPKPQVRRILSSANVSYNLSDEMLVRATYGQTLNRPEFRELANFAYYDFENNWVTKGNPNLRTAKVQNFDVRWEWYPSKAEMVTVGGFYKQFEDAIELYITPGSGSVRTFEYINAQSANVYGVEVDMRKSLSSVFQSGLFSKFSVLFNAAFIRSAVQVQTRSGFDLPERPLMGQSPYVVNAGLYYNDDDRDLQIAALYNVAGRRLFAVGGYTDTNPPQIQDEDIYEMPRNVLDFSISKTFHERFQMKLNISDILNQKYMLLQDADHDEKFEVSRDQILQSNRFGTLFTLGLSYKIW
jgi:TonB-dependent receptor